MPKVPNAAKIKKYFLKTWVKDNIRIYRYQFLLKIILLYFFSKKLLGEFATSMWNHSDTKTTRSNNHVESFHGRLNKMASKSHPNIYQVISLFRNIDCMSMVKTLIITVMIP